MRCLSRKKSTGPTKTIAKQLIVSPALLCLLAISYGMWMQACGGGAGVSSVVTSPPPSPPSISVTVTPPNSSVILGNSQTFSARVTNTTNTNVAWAVNGVPGGNSIVGTISSTGVYTAPTDLPAPPIVNVAATSQADTTQSATAAVTITSDIALSISPNAAGVLLGATQSFQSSIVSSGHPDTAVRWSISGGACPTNCGAVASNGTYTAPQILASPSSVTLTAQSMADLSKQSFASINISSNFLLQLSAPSNVQPGGTAVVVATLTPAPGSEPSDVLSWALTGAGCKGSTCGILTVVTTQAQAGNVMESSATYTAPAVAPTPDTVTVTVTPQADTSKAVQATVAIQSGAAVSLTPVTATLAASHRDSNAVSIVVAQPNRSDGALSLTSSAPIASGNDILVVEPTTAGVSILGDDLDLNVAALGTFSSTNNSCVLAGNPILLQRPATGTTTADVCLFSQSGLDNSMSYIISGPGDITIIAKQPAGLGIIHLTLQIPPNASPGARTIFIQNTNLDKTAASGALEIN